MKEQPTQDKETDVRKYIESAIENNDGVDLIFELLASKDKQIAELEMNLHQCSLLDDEQTEEIQKLKSQLSTTREDVAKDIQTYLYAHGLIPLQDITNFEIKLSKYLKREK